MKILDPNLSILDETDSGLDIDALKTVAKGVNSSRDNKKSFLVITHYQRLLNYIKPVFSSSSANSPHPVLIIFPSDNTCTKSGFI